MANSHKHIRVLTDAQIAAIVFNETRSLSGTDIDKARVNVAHTIINGLASSHGLPVMASTIATVPVAEQSVYSACVTAVTTARANLAGGKDPTNGAQHFNFRPNAHTSPFQGHALRTNIGPLNNSYPTADLPATNIYANTYQ